ncbi:MAG: hypothetical protein K0S53_339 [Bacteroidetes bacterium]|jgi:hypothetical protein|nr:hypothetical protein [Bacteroidota bacterium]MDF2453884.1 hypothetical protein [Bacteroidota bacterium]
MEIVENHATKSMINYQKMLFLNIIYEKTHFSNITLL